MSEFMSTRVIEIKRGVDRGGVTPAQTRGRIVDSAKLHKEGAAPRPIPGRRMTEGATMHEMVLKTQADENAEELVVIDEQDRQQVTFALALGAFWERNDPIFCVSSVR